MKHSTLILSLVCLVAMSSCARNCTIDTCGSMSTVEPVPGNQIRGTVSKPYVQPIRDVVTVPAQVDPTNTYYRPSHDTIVEIIPGRVQPIQYGDE